MKNGVWMGILASAGLLLLGNSFMAMGETTLPRVVGHRGLVRQAPENTLAGFSACLELRLGLELDIQRTKDGVLILMHDGEVNRTTNGKGQVSELTLAQIKKLDAGHWFDERFRGEAVPTFEEFLIILKKHAKTNPLICVDVKINDANLARELVGLAKKHGALEYLMFIGRTISEPEFRASLKREDDGARVAVLANKVEDLYAALKDAQGDWVYVRFIPTREQVKRIHGMGKKVILVGPLVGGNEPDNWRRGKEAGIDALLTDFPLECLDSWKEPTGK